MKEQTRRILGPLARPLNLDHLVRLTGKRFIFPFYHTVSPEPLPHISHLYRVLRPEAFERDLDLLLQHFEPLSLAEYLEHPEKKTGRPGMVLSFDDGLKGCYDYIAPLLKKKGIPAVFFLNNRFIDNRGLFYRYKASLLIHRARSDCRVKEKLAGFLKIPGEQLEASIRMIAWDQRALLDVMAREAEVDFSGYMRTKPVYMDGREVRQLLAWGFEVGTHSSEHAAFSGMGPEDMIDQVSSSVTDLQKRFDLKTAYFSFPFTSDGVPEVVIDRLLKEGSVSALFGTAGLKQTGRQAYIQRIPMDEPRATAWDVSRFPAMHQRITSARHPYHNPAREERRTTAMDTLKAEYLYYLLKMPLGRNRLRY